MTRQEKNIINKSVSVLKSLVETTYHTDCEECTVEAIAHFYFVATGAAMNTATLRFGECINSIYVPVYDKTTYIGIVVLKDGMFTCRDSQLQRELTYQTCGRF